jgi:hypothetical protein
MTITRCTLALVLALALAGGAAATAPLRDPFARPAAPVPAAAPAPGDAGPVAEPPPALRAIMYEPGHSLANIGGQILTVGEWYRDYRIVRIDERSVTLLRAKVKSVIELDQESSK